MEIGPLPGDGSEVMRSLGLTWIAAAMVWGLLVYYLLIGWLLRVRGKQATVTTLYQPPEGISPALAAYFLHPGDLVISLATCLVDLAERGSIRLKPVPVDGYRIEPADDNVTVLWWEREVRGRLLECTLSPRTVRDASELLNSLLDRQVVPRYVSPHNFLFFLPSIVPIVVSLQILSPYLDPKGRIAVIVMAGICYLATIWFEPFGGNTRSWPPEDPEQSSAPVQASDVRAVWVTIMAVALLCLAAAFLQAWLPLAGGFALATILGRSLLRAPTREGWELYTRLQGFKCFVASVEADPINVLNAPAEIPEKIQKDLAFALAFDVEHSWGERLLELLAHQLQSARGEELIREAMERSLENRTYPTDL
jgi:Predicted membrane protein (DUF2207)